MASGTKQAAKIFIASAMGYAQETTFFGIVLESCGPVWFFLAMAIGMVIFNLLANYLEGEKLLLATGLLAILGWLSSINICLPWTISQALVSTFYIGLGHYAKKKKMFTSGEHIKGITMMPITNKKPFPKLFAVKYDITSFNKKYTNIENTIILLNVITLLSKRILVIIS